MLHTCCSTSAAKLTSAAAAVGKLRKEQLEEGVVDLASNPSAAPDALLSLLAALQRVKVLVVAGADELSRDKQVAKACQVRRRSHKDSLVCCVSASVCCLCCAVAAHRLALPFTQVHATHCSTSERQLVQ